MAKTIKGRLAVWKDKKGFGFIKPEDGSDDVFIHITSLQDMSRRPFIGDTIFFQIQQEKDGRSKAVNATIEGVAVDTSKNNDGVGIRGFLKWLVIIVLLMLLAIAGLFGYDKYANEGEIFDSMANLQSTQKLSS